ncbi:MAG: chorismate-binding protein [Bacteroidetes bacterium]|nr:chorismate-binding protein [Bacteroidota bacterium]
MNLTEVGKAISLEEVLDVFLQEGLASGGSFALWRKPNSSQLAFIQDFSQSPRRVSLHVEELPAGFVVHPFADQEDKKAFFIQADRYEKLSIESQLSQEDLPSWMQANKEAFEGAELKKNILKLLAGLNPQSTAAITETHDKEHFLQLVERGIQAIATGTLEKIVPARTKVIPIPEGFDLGRTLATLLSQYPYSFVNFFHIPHVGTWMGASPETLIKTEGDYFYTMSLAGTQPAQGNNPLKSAAWTQKEIEEQALVSRYVVDCFKTIRLREYEEHGPKTILAGNLLHLRSDFKVNMQSTGFSNLGSVMLSLLHPTSAVCGMPRKEAQAFLKAYEGIDRSFYSGFLGPVQVEGATSLFVNLRTASFRDGQVVLYAGAGVTEDSEPEKEWEETELKCEIIGRFIQNQYP